jgi:hypothetical protein
METSAPADMAQFIIQLADDSIDKVIVDDALDLFSRAVGGCPR